MARTTARRPHAGPDARRLRRRALRRPVRHDSVARMAHSSAHHLGLLPRTLRCEHLRLDFRRHPAGSARFRRRIDEHSRMAGRRRIAPIVIAWLSSAYGLSGAIALASLVYMMAGLLLFTAA